jgi:hypothetical protein
MRRCGPHDACATPLPPLLAPPTVILPARIRPTPLALPSPSTMPSSAELVEVPEGHYALDLAPARSFHGVLTLRLPSSPPPTPPPAASNCSLQALFAFAPELIIDSYQLPSDIWIQYYGHGELELPAVRADKLGTGLRAHLDGLAVGKHELSFKVDGRYLPPAEQGEADSRSVEIDLPWVGWVCDVGDSDATSASCRSWPSSCGLKSPTTYHVAHLFRRHSALALSSGTTRQLDAPSAHAGQGTAASRPDAASRPRFRPRLGRARDRHRRLGVRRLGCVQGLESLSI